MMADLFVVYYTTENTGVSVRAGYTNSLELKNLVNRMAKLEICTGWEAHDWSANTEKKIEIYQSLDGGSVGLAKDLGSSKERWATADVSKIRQEDARLRELTVLIVISRLKELRSSEELCNG
jgi:hypothetical protein